MQRLLHRILAKRLSASVDLHPLQRGFTSTDGTLANTIMLDHYIRSRRAKGKTYNIISLVVRKAFDTVAHPAIVGALDRLGVSPAVTEYIQSTLRDANTTITVGGWTSRPIAFKRGVKQGDPLSPFLFNAVLDELVESLNMERPE